MGFCVQVDLCDPQPCAEGRICEDRGNNYSCECPKGYTGPQCNEPLKAVRKTLFPPETKTEKRNLLHVDFVFFFHVHRFAAAIRVNMAELVGVALIRFIALAVPVIPVKHVPKNYPLIKSNRVRNLTLNNSRKFTIIETFPSDFV